MSGRKRNPYPFIPKYAYNWKKVMDITSGLGIAPLELSPVFDTTLEANFR